MEINKQKFTVGVIKLASSRYPKHSPYHPNTLYPEYPFGKNISPEKNYAYEGVRNLLHELGMDKKNWNTKRWNPLGTLIKPGMKVVIKPNFVLSRHFTGGDIYSIITHPSVLRAIVDYSWIALRGKGRIIICDAPQYNCDFQELLEVTQLEKIIEFINSTNGTPLELYDLRNYWAKGRHFPSNKRPLPGDPEGTVTVNLGSRSALSHHLHPEKLYGAVYDRAETIRHHTRKTQEYELAKIIMTADVLINVPKLKVHKKVGVTLNYKNLVGINVNKNLIVHYTLGLPSEGGDQFPEHTLTPIQKRVIKFERFMYDAFLAKNSIFLEMVHRTIYGFLYLKIFRHFGLNIPHDKRILDAGNWHGNDSAWRMVVDLATIIHHKHKLRTFSIIDGITGGENQGPLVPDAKKSAVLVGGENFLAADLVATRLMGFDPLKIKQYVKLLSQKFGPGKFSDIKIISNNSQFKQCLQNTQNRYLNFKPHPGWIGHIEVTK